MIIIGLTGSIGMGKSTTAELFAKHGLPVWDADAAVHRLYAPGGVGVGPVLTAFPDCGSENGGIDRAALSQHLLTNPQDFTKLEAVIHPLVAGDRRGFLALAEERGNAAVLLDIPLLFEGGYADPLDAVVVVTADEVVRRKRVLARPGMTADKYQAIVARQMPEVQKRAKADYLIWTDKGIAAAELDVDKIISAILGKPS